MQSRCLWFEDWLSLEKAHSKFVLQQSLLNGSNLELLSFSN